MCNCNHSTPAKRAREIRAYTAYLDAIEAGDRSFIAEPESLDPAELALEIDAEIEIVEDYLRQLSHENQTPIPHKTQLHSSCYACL